METMKLPTVWFVLSKSLMINWTPGATIDDARGVRKVMPETILMFPHLLFTDQFSGFP